MEFGFCTAWENASTVALAGFDYIEPSVVGALKPESSWDDTPFSSPSLEGRAGEGWILPIEPIKALAFMGFLPGDLKVVGPDIDNARVQAYLDTAFDRLARVESKTVVFGSGGARRVPEGWSREDARAQIVDFLHHCAPLAAAHEVTVAIEPLGSRECNIINSVDEAMDYVRAVDHPSIQVLADLYHIDSEGQSHAESGHAGPALRHVHIAGREGRRVPTEDDVDYLAAYFRILKHAGYDSRISVEARVVDLALEAPLAAIVVRKAWEMA